MMLATHVFRDAGGYILRLDEMDMARGASAFQLVVTSTVREGEDGPAHVSTFDLSESDAATLGQLLLSKAGAK